MDTDAKPEEFSHANIVEIRSVDSFGCLIANGGSEHDHEPAFTASRDIFSKAPSIRFDLDAFRKLNALAGSALITE